MCVKFFHIPPSNLGAVEPHGTEAARVRRMLTRCMQELKLLHTIFLDESGHCRHRRLMRVSCEGEGAGVHHIVEAECTLPDGYRGVPAYSKHHLTL